MSNEYVRQFKLFKSNEDGELLFQHTDLRGWVDDKLLELHDLKDDFTHPDCYEVATRLLGSFKKMIDDVKEQYEEAERHRPQIEAPKEEGKSRHLNLIQ